MRSVLSGIAAASVLLAAAVSTALADQPDYSPEGIPSASIASSLPANGDPAGYRKWLAAKGITYNFLYTGDLLANMRGGDKRGVVAQGKLETSLSIDFEKLVGFNGLSFYGNFFQIHNTGRIRRDYVGGINTIAAIEGVPSTRLSELWLEQKFWDGKASVRFGQLAADVEFFYAGISSLFLQSDWAAITGLNMPSGGPAYPLSTPGVRIKVEPVENVALLVAVFNGDPAGPGAGDEQIRNHYGTNFRIGDPALIMAETQIGANRGKTDIGLARMIKVGGWSHLGTFEDRRFTPTGGLIADPMGSGQAALRRGNWGVYGVIEQQIYRPQGGDAESGITLFSRVSASPSDRNPVDFFVDGGVVFAGLVPNRPDDKFGASIMYTRFSDGQRNYDRDVIAFTGLPGVVRDYEMNLELTYMAQVIPGWTVQPMMTFIWHPSGDASRNAIVSGMRSIWRF